MNTPNRTSKPTPLVEVNGVFLSLNYIRDRALALLGSEFTKTNNHGQNSHTYHTTITGVTFERQNGAWQTGALVNSPTSAEALEDYFYRLLEAKQVKKGKKFFRWDEEEMMFVERTK